jgi:hypothetical protein
VNEDDEEADEHWERVGHPGIAQSEWFADLHVAVPLDEAHEQDQ